LRRASLSVNSATTWSSPGRTYWKETLQRIFQFYDQATAHFSFDDRVALVHYLNALQKDLAGVELPKSGLPKRNRS
jgi:hypothetical protein